MGKHWKKQILFGGLREIEEVVRVRMWTCWKVRSSMVEFEFYDNELILNDNIY